MQAYLDSHILNQLGRVPAPAPAGLGAQVDEVVAVVVAVAHDVALGVVQQGQQLAVIAAAALGRQLPIEAPHAAAQRRPPVVHGLAGREPVAEQKRVGVSQGVS